MGFEEVLRSIREKAESETNAIIEQAESESASILEDANAKASAYIALMDSRAKSDSARLIASTESRANIEAKHLIDKEVNQKLADAMAMLQAYLQEYSKSEEYAKLMGALSEKALKLLGECTIYVQKRDLKLLKGAKASEESFLGGLIAVSKDGTKQVDYTLEGILSRISDSVMSKLIKEIKVSG
ncbi:MAG: V-type ATP synthase subunit E [Candidatus Micrarchaeia archaeon]